jgi:hypothetical protein
MRLHTSRSLDDTVEQFWALRALAERLLAPFRRRQLIAHYEKLPANILDDIGLPASAIRAAKADPSPAPARLAAAAREARAAAASADVLERLDARIPFARRRTPAPRVIRPAATDGALTGGATAERAAGETSTPRDLAA